MHFIFHGVRKIGAWVFRRDDAMVTVPSHSNHPTGGSGPGNVLTQRAQNCSAIATALKRADALLMVS